jgi:glycosyltransferase involved in cell wall biosynthesis
MADKFKASHRNPRKPVLVHITTVPESLWAFFQGQIGFMKEHGLEMQAISSPGEWLDRFASREEVVVHSVKMERKITPLKDCAALIRMVCLLHHLKPDIVHSHTPKGGLLGMLAAWLAKVPIRVYHIRGLPMTTASGLKRLILKGVEIISCRLAHQVLCVSRSVAREAVEYGLCSAEKIRVLGAGGNGVDAIGKFNPALLGNNTGRRVRTEFKIPDDALVLGFVGRIVRDKGIGELVKAWKSLRDEFPTLHLLIVGPFEHQDSIPSEVESQLRNDPRIHLAGAVQDMPPYYTAMDICVLPTYREGFPNVAVEAAAMELPVVATRVPGCLDAVIHGTTGLLVPPRKAELLTDDLRTYLNWPFLRKKHGQAGRKHVIKHFQPKMIWQELLQVYINLLREKGLSLPVPERPLAADSSKERRIA